MSPLTHRAPGVVGAVLESAAVAAEIICDGHHVHPAAVALALRAKTATRLMAITDGTAAAGLPLGSRAMLGGRPIIVAQRTRTTRGRHAGRQHHHHGPGVPDAGHSRLVLPIERRGPDVFDHAGRPAGSDDAGRHRPALRADLVVLDAGLRVVQTWIGGRPIQEHSSPRSSVYTGQVSQTIPPDPTFVSRPCRARGLAAAAAACEVNLNTEGVTLEGKANIRRHRPAGPDPGNLRRRHRNPLVGSQRGGSRNREARAWSRACSTR